MKQINTYINEKLHLSTKNTYTCQPNSKDELKEIIIQRIEDEGHNCDLNDIDTSKITDMSCLFYTSKFESDYTIFKNFNGDISMWDVSNVENMRWMFYQCKKFNCDLSRWNVSNVKDMEGTFNRCGVFNCDLSKWNVSNVLDMNYMFYNCEEFDCNLSKWDVSNVKTMDGAFEHCPTQPTWYK